VLTSTAMWSITASVRKRDYPFSNKPKQHFELGEALGQMDFEAAAKLSGSRFRSAEEGAGKT